MNQKFVLLDTNILLHDPMALFAYAHATVILHFDILNELDSFKKEGSERGYNAREVIRLLEEMRVTGSLLDGVILNNGGMLQIIMPEQVSQNSLLSHSTDDKIIQLALSLKDAHKTVVIVSKDLTLRIKANQFNVDVEDFHNAAISKDNFYQGWKEFFFPSGDIKFNANEILQDLMTKNTFIFNEFVILRSSHKDDYYRIFRYRSDNTFTPVSSHAEILWGIQGKNPQQEMVIDLLLDDSVKLVILCGPSGTGKTFLVLASLLYKVLCTETYHKLLVSRPLVPLGPDIGYLPGDLYEKLQTWMQPVRDNLEYLLYNINQEITISGRAVLCNDNPSEIKKEKRYKKKGWKNFNNFSNNNYLSMEELVGSHGKVALEAITYMRGRSIPNQAIFIDEVQNLTAHEVKTLISRAGEGSKIVLVGDPYQIDSPYLDFSTNGLVIASERFKGQEVFGSVYLHVSERSILSSLANKLM